MNSYVVEAGTPVIVVKEGDPWEKGHFRVTVTKYSNTFGQENVLVDPVSLSCDYNAPYARQVGAALSFCGYFAFKQRGFILICEVEKVTIMTGGGVWKASPFVDREVFWSELEKILKRKEAQ